MSLEITIDPELQSIIQPLTAVELETLTEQIRRDGCLEPLCVWKTESGQRILLDGHNRYAICQKLPRGYNTVNVKLASRERAKLWILEHQAGRRNLTDDQRAVIWNDIREQRSKIASQEGAAKARAAKSDSANLTESTPQPKSGTRQEEPLPQPKRDTRREIAQESRIPESKLRKVQQLKEANPALYDAVRTGKVTLRQARPTPAVKSQRERYSEKEFFARIGRMLAGTLLKHPLLDELLAIKKSDWTPEVQEAFPRLIANLHEVSKRAEMYADELKAVLKRHGKKAA